MKSLSGAPFCSAKLGFVDPGLTATGSMGAIPGSLIAATQHMQVYEPVSL